MKKILFIAIALMAIQTSFAQTFSKGDTFVEGTVKFVSSDDTKTFNFSPTIGHFVTDKVAVGAFLNTENTKTSGATTTDSFGFGIFARYYFLKIGEHFNVHTQYQMGLNNDTAGDIKSLSANLGLGANYFVTKNLSLTVSVADLASYKSIDGGDSTTTIGFSGVTNPFTTPSFGVNYRF
jgi:outer membrane protein